MVQSKEEGICVYMQLIHFTIQQKLIQHCKATTYSNKIFKNKL